MLETADEGLKYKEILSNASLEKNLKKMAVVPSKRREIKFWLLNNNNFITRG